MKINRCLLFGVISKTQSKWLVISYIEYGNYRINTYNFPSIYQYNEVNIGVSAYRLFEMRAHILNKIGSDIVI